MTQNNVKKIAVTGGIGSGKSVVCQIIRDFGYPVFSCDEIYKKMQRDKDYLSMIDTAFLGVVKKGVLDKKALSEIVFSDKSQLEKLNSLTHPAIIQKLYAQMEKYPVSFAEVPLLFESGKKDDFDGVIVVYREIENRIAAVCERDKLTRDNVISRIKNQADYEKIIKEGHTVIYNDGDYISLQKKVKVAIEEVLR